MTVMPVSIIRHQIMRHRPTRRRLRFILLAGFPIIALVARCTCCDRIWPCRDLLFLLRHHFGWTHRLDGIIERLRRNSHLRRKAGWFLCCAA